MDGILISGYYGFKNSGDDALLLSIINDLRKHKKEIEIVVLSSNPKETNRIYGVKSINRLNLFKIIPTMFKAKMLISGGGTLIQDGTSTKSLLYYLSIIRMAKFFKLKIMLYSNGIGPLNHKTNRKLTKKVLNKVDMITLRDAVSQTELKKIGVTKPQIHLTADPAFTHTPSDDDIGRGILESEGTDMSKKLLCISVRKWKTAGEQFEKDIANAIDYAVEKYDLYPVFLPMQLKNDYEISCSIKARMKSDASIIKDDQTTGDILSIIKQTHLCIGMRLHTLIYAASQSVPLIGLVYDPKVSGFMDYMHQSKYIDVECINKESLIQLIDDTIKSYDEIKSDLSKNTEKLKLKAEENAKYAIELLEK